MQNLVNVLDGYGVLAMRIKGELIKFRAGR